MDQPITKWQIKRELIKKRGKYLLYSGKYSDCTFLLGHKPNQQSIPSHKLVLAMASPIFEVMFFGKHPEKSNLIPLVDIKPSAFKAILEYFYTDHITLKSVDQACDLYYGAKMYRVPLIVDRCMKFLWNTLSPKNVCRIYEFAKEYQEKVLLEKSLAIICGQTIKVLREPSFEYSNPTTLNDILAQDHLNIKSELDLFEGIVRHMRNQAKHIDDELTGDKKNASDYLNTIGNHPVYRNAIKQIRFLTLSPGEFARFTGRNNLLTESEAFAILVNIASQAGNYPMPDGFTLNNHIRTFSVNHMYDSKPSKANS